MDENFILFLNDIPAKLQGFVSDLDHFLLEKACKRKFTYLSNRIYIQHEWRRI